MSTQFEGAFDPERQLDYLSPGAIGQLQRCLLEDPAVVLEGLAVGPRASFVALGLAEVGDDRETPRLTENGMLMITYLAFNELVD